MRSPEQPTPPLKEGGKDFPVNISLIPAQAESIFPGVLQQEGKPTREVMQRILLGEPIEPIPHIRITPVNSTLGLIVLPDQDGEARFGITGNTVGRLCPHGDCASHGPDKPNCATLNTEKAFAGAGQENPKGRFMLLPLSDDVIFVGDENIPVTPVKVPGKKEDAFQKFGDLKSRAVIFGQEWAGREGMDNITVGINGADSTFGTMSLNIKDENFVVAFCTTRENLGDRPEEFKVLKKAINTIIERKGVSNEDRASVLAGLDIRIDLIASATLKNFAHDIRVPHPGSNQAKDLAEKLSLTDEEFSAHYIVTQEINRINTELAKEDLAAERRSELDRELANINVGDAITPSQVMDWQYPGALGNGFVYGASNVEMHLEPRGPKGCPGFGELCHIDYRGITERSVVGQLSELGIKNIEWHEENAIDPADPDNDLASNRREQLAGVPIAKTDRTFNGVSINYLAA